MLKVCYLLLELSKLILLGDAHQIFGDFLSLEGVGVQVFDHGLGGGGASLRHDPQGRVGVLTLGSETEPFK